MNAFIAQFDEDDDVVNVLLAEYAAQLAGGETEAEALAYVVQFVNEEYDIERPATMADIQEVLDGVDEGTMTQAIAEAIRAEREEKAVETYRAERQAGATFLDAVKATGQPLPAVVRALERNRYNLDSATLATLNEANQEQHAVKGYEARQRLFGLIGRKLTRVVRKADYSKMPPEKAIDLLLKLAELTRDEKPPSVSVCIGHDRV